MRKREGGPENAEDTRDVIRAPSESCRRIRRSLKYRGIKVSITSPNEKILGCEEADYEYVIIPWRQRGEENTDNTRFYEQLESIFI